MVCIAYVVNPMRLLTLPISREGKGKESSKGGRVKRGGGKWPQRPPLGDWERGGRGE